MGQDLPVRGLPYKCPAPGGLTVQQKELAGETLAPGTQNENPGPTKIPPLERNCPKVTSTWYN